MNQAVHAMYVTRAKKVDNIFLFLKEKICFVCSNILNSTSIGFSLTDTSGASSNVTGLSIV